MSKTSPNKSEIYNEIEQLYFSDKFSEVVEFWERNISNYQIDYKNQADNNVLEALATSYYETGMYDRSLFYIDAQIVQLKTLKLPSHEKKNKYRYYYLNKVNIYFKQNKRFLEYKTIGAYIQDFGKDETFQELFKSLEEYFYRKYLLINRYFGYVILIIIAIAMLMPLLNLHIPNNIYKPYNIISIICVIWIVLNLLLPKIFKRYFLYVMRCLFILHS
ncbi:MAG: hypothetical protein PHD06_12840 [Bacteroidales bacterium]|nr:hypothetical protein [Bacteroidales bacterium]